VAADWALIVAGALGGGGLTQFWHTHQQRKMADTQRAHERTMVSDDRSYRARSEAYVALLADLTKVMNDVEATYPMLEPHPTLDLASTDEERVLVAAKVSAHGSVEMNELLEVWSDHGVKFNAHAETIRDEETRAGSGVAAEWRSRLEQERQAMRDLVKRMGAQARRELSGQSAHT
jgi:hypothetical protein